MVAEPKPEPFITEELAELAKGLEGVIHEPRSLPQELREMPVWLKVTLNERGQWKKPCVEFRGKLSSYNWKLSSYHLALDVVLKQQPAGKAGFHASGSLCVIDLDEVIDPVTRQLKEPKVHDLFEYLKASVYVSSSGKGLHIIFRLQEGVEIDPPSTKLSYRDTEGKSGEFLGGKFPSFVAFTGVAVPQYDYPWLVEISQEEWEWLREFLWSVETVPLTEPSEPITLPTPVSTPQARAPRESEANNPPFDIDWKPNYIQHVRNMLRGFNDRPEGSDETPSGLVYDWVLVYWKGAKKPTWDGAVTLSIRAEGYARKRQPGTSSKKPKKWHEGNVISALKQLANKGELVYRRKGDKEGQTPEEDQQLQALKYIQSEKMKPSTQKVFLQIVAAAKGRDHYRLTNEEIADAVGLDRSTIIHHKNKLANNDFLEIKGNVYKILGI